MVILTLHVSLHSVYAKTDDAFDPPITGVLLTLSALKWTVKLEKVHSLESILTTCP